MVARTVVVSAATREREARAVAAVREASVVRVVDVAREVASVVAHVETADVARVELVERREASPARGVHSTR